jgi:hypothetical protein
MVVVLAMLLAFLAAAAARLDTGKEHGACELAVSGVRATQYAGRRPTHVGAVEVEGDAAAKVCRLGLGEACVGADRAVLSARDALLDAPCGRLAL